MGIIETVLAAAIVVYAIHHHYKLQALKAAQPPERQTSTINGLTTNRPAPPGPSAAPVRLSRRLPPVSTVDERARNSARQHAHTSTARPDAPPGDTNRMPPPSGRAEVEMSGVRMINPLVSVPVGHAVRANSGSYSDESLESSFDYTESEEDGGGYSVANPLFAVPIAGVAHAAGGGSYSGASKSYESSITYSYSDDDVVVGGHGGQLEQKQPERQEEHRRDAYNRPKGSDDPYSSADNGRRNLAADANSSSGDSV